MASRGAIRAGLGSIADAIREKAKFEREQTGRDIFADILEENPRLLGLQEGLQKQGFGATPRAGVPSGQQGVQQRNQILPGVMTPNITQKLGEILRIGGKNGTALVSSAINMINTANINRIEAGKREMKRLFKEATFLESFDDPETQSAAIQAQIAEGKRSGRDTTGLEELLSTPFDARGPLYTKTKILNNKFENVVTERLNTIKFEREQQVAAKKKEAPSKFAFFDFLEGLSPLDQDEALERRLRRLSPGSKEFRLLRGIRILTDEDRDRAIAQEKARFEPKDILKQRIGEERAERVAIGKEARTPQETFTPVLDDQGNILGQRSSLTGEVKTDPRTEKAPAGAVSPPGKIEEDRRDLVSKFGVDSLEVKRFDKIVKESTKDKDTGRFFTLPNGQRISRGELLAEYRVDTNILSPLEIRLLAVSNPKAAAREKVRASKAVPFAKWAKRERGVDVRGGFELEEEIETSPVALPKTKAGLVKGRIYQTGRGPATWDGKMFESVGN